MPLLAAQHSLFRAYDIRGDEQYFTPRFVQALGEAFVRLYQHYHTTHRLKPITHHQLPSYIKPDATTVIIGYDVRCGSDSIAQTLATILQQQGLQVINLGLITTPMMAFWTEQYDGHGIMVTASHSAKGILGIKWLVGNVSPSAEDIQALYQDSILSDSTQKENSNQESVTTVQNVDDRSNPVPLLSIIGLPTDTVAAPYIQAIAEVFTTIYPQQNLSATSRWAVKKLDLTIVIDCMHGATSRIALPLFSQFCQHVIIINDTPDGSFPMGNPDPTEPNRLAELQQTVIINAADIGLAFDGDGDRLMIVDNSGKVVVPDHLLYLLAQVAITERPKPHNSDTTLAPQVLFDIKCSHHLPILLSNLGAIPIISKTGSSFMRQQLRSCDRRIVFAGELSSHFIFNDGYFTAYDDAMYAGLRLLHWLVYTAAPSDKPLPDVDVWGEKVDTPPAYRLTDITRQLPTLVSTADHYLPLPDTAPQHCSVVRQLADYCHHLQDLVATNGDNLSDKPTTTCASSHCTCSAKRQSITMAEAERLLPLGTRLTCIDGVRLDFTHGFGVLRRSNTSHNLTVRFAGDRPEDLKDIQERFVALCRPFDKNLAAQIACIHSE